MGNNKSSREAMVATFCFEAKRWVGCVEEGQNGGQLVRLFQRAVDNRADAEAWCMAFAQYCIKMTELLSMELFPEQEIEPSRIFRSEHCLTVWNRSPQLQKREPSRGSLCIWQRYNGHEPTANGHTGIVTDIHEDGSLSVIEGNTSNSSSEANMREGDGVYLKRYARGHLDRGSLILKGFLNPWD